MDAEVAQRLIALNKAFYQKLASPFSATRNQVQPGVKRVLDDVPKDASILDLGCGTGILAIGANLLGADFVSGIDCDAEAIRQAKDAAAAAGVEVTFEAADVSKVDGSFDTVVQNPPFGAQNRHADRPFLELAITLAPVVYTFHLTKTVDFVKAYAAELGADFTHTWEHDFQIRHQFHFHEKEVERVKVTLFRFVRIED